MPPRSTFLAACLLACVAVFAGCETAPPSTSDGVFIHVKSGPDDSHAALMALSMAQTMADGRDVLLYFDVDGIEVVLADGSDLEMPPFGSSKAMLRRLLDRGVPVLACPGCLEALGHEPSDLMPGVEVAEKEAFFGFTQGRILTLDY